MAHILAHMRGWHISFAGGRSSPAATFDALPAASGDIGVHEQGGDEAHLDQAALANSYRAHQSPRCPVATNARSTTSVDFGGDALLNTSVRGRRAQRAWLTGRTNTGSDTGRLDNVHGAAW